MSTSRREAVVRADAACEAMVPVGGKFTRCGVRSVDVHHRLPRRRGGSLLDRELEIYHLVCLCRPHHEWTHRRPNLATELGLFIEGEAVRNGTYIIYTGPDEYLLNKYGEGLQYEIQGNGSAW